MHACETAEEEKGLAEGARETRGGMHAWQVERSTAHGAQHVERSAAHEARHVERGTWNGCMHARRMERGTWSAAHGAQHMKRSMHAPDKSSSGDGWEVISLRAAQHNSTCLQQPA